MTFASTIGLAALTVFEVVVAWLTQREYLRQRCRPVAQRGLARPRSVPRG
jgi:hypothetical protein